MYGAHYGNGRCFDSRDRKGASLFHRGFGVVVEGRSMLIWLSFHCGRRLMGLAAFALKSYQGGLS
jgi:hypothetical protein